MKKFLFVSILLLCLTSCYENNFFCTKIAISQNMELRQLTNDIETKDKAKGHFFFAWGSYSDEIYKTNTLDVFAKIDGKFRLIQIKLLDIRINIDNSLTRPTLQIQVKVNGLKNISKITETEFVETNLDKLYIINCPEQYLPEKLLPIDNL